MTFLPGHPYLPQMLRIIEAEHANIVQDVALLQLHIMRRRRREARRRRTMWVRDWLARRKRFGWYDTLMIELEFEDTPSFKNLTRVQPAMFHELLHRLSPRLKRQTTNWRKPIEPGLQLAIALRHLATGDNYLTLQYAFRVAHNTVGLIVCRVCQAIIDELQDEVCRPPSTADEWRAVAEGFSNRWNFHHCLGALDGKHIAIRCPRNGGSLYYNYKKFHSIVLMAIVDADYKFLWVDIGANGSCSDGQIFNQCELKDMLEEQLLAVPEASPLIQDDRPTPYFFIADDAFPLRTWMMKPFSRRNLEADERIFNYRLSRARRVVENAFGILTTRFGCFLRTLQQEPRFVQKMVMAAVCLHNLMRIRYPGGQNVQLDKEDDDHNLVPGSWRDGAQMMDLGNVRGGNRTTRAAKIQRLYLKHYYNSPVGAVPWQNQVV